MFVLCLPTYGSDPIGSSMMDAPSDATMGSPLLVPFDGSTHAESVFPYLALLADGDQEVILLQVVPEAQSVSSPMGDVMLSANELRQATESAARADLDRAAAKLAPIAPSLRIEQLVETGDPSQRISEVAIRRKARGSCFRVRASVRPGLAGSARWSVES